MPFPLRTWAIKYLHDFSLLSSSSSLSYLSQFMYSQSFTRAVLVGYALISVPPICFASVKFSKISFLLSLKNSIRFFRMLSMRFLFVSIFYLLKCNVILVSGSKSCPVRTCHIVLWAGSPAISLIFEHKFYWSEQLHFHIPLPLYIDIWYDISQSLYMFPFVWPDLRQHCSYQTNNKNLYFNEWPTWTEDFPRFL